MHGWGGVAIAGSSQRGSGPLLPEKMTADDVTGEFGPHGTLTAMTGHGHASVAETTAIGTQQTTSGDVLVAHLGDAEAAQGNGKRTNAKAMQIESATVDGNVVLTQTRLAKAGVAPSTMRATAGHADYDGNGQWLHLMGNPRVTDGPMEISADKLNVSQGTGDAYAIGNVKATWTGKAASEAAGVGVRKPTGTGTELGAQGPTHAVAQEAELERSGLATFKGDARLWQQGNSVVAPVIVLDRSKQTLVAQTASAKNPVEIVLVSAASVTPGRQTGSKQGGPSVIRVHGGDLKYSSAERLAVMQAGATCNVVVSTADATTTSSRLELLLLPPGNHAGKDGAAAQVDRMTSTGHVEISSGGRRGTGEKLVYSGDAGDYTLTGTAAEQPRLTDPARGTVTGSVLIFNSRDDSVKVDGDGRKTSTVTTAPK
jgi:lipopolysaccharide export system protein LptA